VVGTTGLPFRDSTALPHTPAGFNGPAFNGRGRKDGKKEQGGRREGKKKVKVPSL